MSKNSETKAVKNILLVAITRLGDLLQASPTIVGMKRTFPNAKLTVLVDQEFAGICKGIPGIDELYEIDLSQVVRSLHRQGAGIVDAYAYLTEFVDDLKARDFDYCVNMASAGYTALLVKLLDIERSYGWVADDEGYRLISSPWSMLFAAFVYHSNRHYNSINLVDILRCAAGVSDHPKHLMYEVPAELDGFAHTFLSENGIGAERGGPLICLQAGASQEKRQWAPVRFARLLQLLVEESNARVILTGAKSEEPIIERILAMYSNDRVVSAVGRTSLGQLGALLQEADILVTGDTGPMHLSVAVGTPVVALFLASAYCFETGPYSKGNIIIQPEISCNPCNPNFSCPRPDCHDQITPELVQHLVALRLGVSDEDVATLKPDATLAPASEVGVYHSTFDEDGFLDFRRLNAAEARLGYDPRYFSAARDAYRQVWKEEFGMAPVREQEASVDQSVLKVVDHRDEITGGLSQVAELAGLGGSIALELEKLVVDSSSPAQALGEANTKINVINLQIDELGLTYPALGALVRMFTMERENLRGDDPAQLARDTALLYENLRRRSQKFAKLFGYYVDRGGH